MTQPDLVIRGAVLVATVDDARTEIAGGWVVVVEGVEVPGELVAVGVAGGLK